MLFYREGVRVKIMVKLYFPGKRKTKNYPVKMSVNGTPQGTRQFSQERVRLKINQSKLVLVVHMAQCYFRMKE